MQSNRYVPDRPFPTYAFVPGMHPHPMTEPGGHHFGKPHVVPPPLDAAHPELSPDFLYAIDLFNAGYYWEAHEAWEGLWIAAGRSGQLADFLKALIKLAAAGVKSREGMPAGVQRHARRAAELFQSLCQFPSANRQRIAGLFLNELIGTANSLALAPVSDNTPSVEGRTVLPCRLTVDVGEKPE